MTAEAKKEISKFQPATVRTMSVYSREEIDLIKMTVAKEATDLELRLFLHTCQRSKLDPLRKQIYFAKIKGRVTVMAGVDGLQARAEDFPDYKGTTGFAVCEKDEFLFDAIKGRPVSHIFPAVRGDAVGAWATVKRKGKTPFSVFVKMSEYNKNENNWLLMPTVMIEKCARMTALRRAFPDPFSGIYDPAELDRVRSISDLPDGNKGKILAELKKISKDMTDEVLTDIKLRALGQDRVTELDNSGGYTKEDYEKMMTGLKSYIAGLNSGPGESEVNPEVPPCSKCGKPLGDSKAQGDKGVLCSVCAPKTE